MVVFAGALSAVSGFCVQRAAIGAQLQGVDEPQLRQLMQKDGIYRHELAVVTVFWQENPKYFVW
ncbi:hypothetical protein N5J07_05485 [Comamonas aquatica]|uniref:hypothetical protein n=1 Tax=Comamonas aquatica TaxID=225991 RepID=UPI002448B2D3|nr:hypothetical protein [Comamonas aquatica]MDH1378915.1 hypothetical protein [Comamonas aquatica]MDH1638895.1 hypothetical protein [Comamonas aquatica]MDH1814340.1 hypothetical protein [Comamonas aquatica]